MRNRKKNLRRLNGLPVEDLRKIAGFFRIVKNYKKIQRIEKLNSHA